VKFLEKINTWIARVETGMLLVIVMFTVIVAFAQVLLRISFTMRLMVGIFFYVILSSGSVLSELLWQRENESTSQSMSYRV